MEVIVVKSYHTFKNGQNFILEEEKFIFCDEIWCYIKEFAGWNYIFDLHKLGIDNLQHICKVNFKFEFSNHLIILLPFLFVYEYVSKIVPFQY